MLTFSISHLSGYDGTIKVINLEPELTSKINSTLNAILGINDTEWEIFIEKLGFNFQLLFDWMDVKKSMNIGNFINTKIESREEEIIQAFQRRPALLKLLKKTEHIENLEVSDEDEVFLQSLNIIIRTKTGQIKWHDRVVEKAFERIRKK